MSKTKIETTVLGISKSVSAVSREFEIVGTGKKKRKVLKEITIEFFGGESSWVIRVANNQEQPSLEEELI